MDYGRWLNCAWMSAMRTKLPFSFYASLTQHLFAVAACLCCDAV